MTFCSRPSRLHLWTFLFALVLLVTAPQAVAQSFNRDCGAGRLLDETTQACGDVETILSRQGTLYWVDQAIGRDSSPGTKAQPWKTISRANQAGQLQPGDAVLVRKGTYREEIRPRTAGRLGRLITFAAYPGETVTVSGSDVVNQPGSGYAGWVRQGDGSWRHDWTWDALPSEGSPLADRRRELFAVNGSVLRQLSGTSRPTIARGQFWVQGPDDRPLAVYLRTDGDTNPNQQFVEVGQRDLLFQPNSKDVCSRSVDGFYRVLLLRFTHSTAKRQRMAVCAGSQGSRIEEIESVWNNAGAIQLTGTGHLVRGAVASDNGIEGIGASGCDRCTVEYSQVERNHWKWWQDEGGRSHGGGGKYANTTNSIVRYNTYSDNEGSGIWLDEKSSGNEIYGNTVDGNLKQGIQIELHSDGNRIYSNVITRTRNYSSIWNGIGISISVSDRNLVAYNTIMGNDGTGIRVGGDNRGTAVATLVYNNLILGNTRSGDSARSIMVLGSGSSDGSSPWELVQTNRVDGNAYAYRDPADVGRDQATFMVSPSGPGDGALYSNLLSEWQDALGFDRRGLVTNTNQPAIVNLQDPVAGWRLLSGSQYAGKAVALPIGVTPVLTDVYGNDRPLSGGSIGAHELDATGGLVDPGGPTAPGGPTPTGAVVFAVNAGGGAFTSADGTVYRADDLFSSGRARDTNEPISGTEDDRLYQSDRSGRFAYHIPVTPGTYEVTLQFAEFEQTSVGARQFGVEIEGTEVFAGIDIFAAVGARKPYTRTSTIVVDDDVLSVRFMQEVHAPKVSALVVRAAPTNQRAVVFAVNAGGGAFTSADGTEYQADDRFTSGRTRITDEPIGGTDDDVLYQSDRSGQFIYRVPVTPGTYEVTLQFAEFERTGAGSRRFGVEIEGAEVLAGVDIFAAVGELKPYTRTVIATVSGDELSIRFMQDVYAPKVSAFVVRPALDGLAASTAGPTSAQSDALAAPPVASQSGESIPGAVEMSAGAPNPTRDRSTFRYGLPEVSEVQIEVFDMLGRSVAVLDQGTRSAGWHSAVVDGTRLPGGVYVVRLQAGPTVAVQRMTISR